MAVDGTNPSENRRRIDIVLAFPRSFHPQKNASASRKAQAVARVVTVLQLKNDAFRQQKLPKAKHQNP